MAYFPFFMDLAEKPGLIVGGGKVALRKIEKLLPFGPALTVIALEFCTEILEIPGLRLFRRAYAPGDEAGMAFVIAATDQRPLNAMISNRCKVNSIPVNVVDNAELCTFLFPALVQRGALTVGISTGGSSPTAAICLKEAVSGLLPEHFEDILDFLHQIRPSLQTRLPCEADRASVLRSLFFAAMERGRPLTDAETELLLTEV